MVGLTRTGTLQADRRGRPTLGVLRRARTNLPADQVPEALRLRADHTTPLDNPAPSTRISTVPLVAPVIIKDHSPRMDSRVRVKVDMDSKALDRINRTMGSRALDREDMEVQQDCSKVVTTATLVSTRHRQGLAHINQGHTDTKAEDTVNSSRDTLSQVAMETHQDHMAAHNRSLRHLLEDRMDLMATRTRVNTIKGTTRLRSRVATVATTTVAANLATEASSTRVKTSNPTSDGKGAMLVKHRSVHSVRTGLMDFLLL